MQSGGRRFGEQRIILRPRAIGLADRLAQQSQGEAKVGIYAFEEFVFWQHGGSEDARDWEAQRDVARFEVGCRGEPAASGLEGAKG